MLLLCNVYMCDFILTCAILFLHEQTPSLWWRYFFFLIQASTLIFIYFLRPKNKVKNEERGNELEDIKTIIAPKQHIDPVLDINFRDPHERE
jgi:hypothetical protein